MSVAVHALLAKVRACDICAATLPLGPNPVLRLNENARILIVGQAPGRRVHETGIPFNDLSGVRLRGWMGIDDTVFYDETRVAFLPMAFCYPGSTKNGDLPPPPACASTWRARLLSHLPHVSLTLLIGRYAIDWHLPDNSGRPIAELVKTWQGLLPSQIALPHPSPRNNLWLKKHPWFERDCIPDLRRRVSEVLIAS